jgi:hypothetical protein
VRLSADKFDNLYGTTVVGGAAGCGTVFELLVVSTQRRPESVIHNFSCGLDGKNPYGGVILDAAGDLYGTTVVRRHLRGRRLWRRIRDHAARRASAAQLHGRR